MIQMYLEETVGIVKDLNENEQQNKVNEKLDKIFKKEEAKKNKQKKIMIYKKKKFKGKGEKYV